MMALRFRLKARMSVAVFLLVSVILLTCGFSLLYYFEAELKKAIAEQQLTLVSRVAEVIDVQIAQAQKIIVKAATGFSPRQLDNPDLAQAFLDSHFEYIYNIFDNGVFLFSANGMLVAESPFIPGHRGRDYSSREYFRSTVETGQPDISATYFSSQAQNHPAIYLTAPIRDDSGKIIGVLAGSIDLTRDNILGRVAMPRINKTGYLYIYSTDRTMILHPDPARTLEQDMPPGANQLFDQAIEGLEGSGETVNRRGLYDLSSYKRLNNINWIVAANYPLNEALIPVRTAQTYFAGGMTLAFLITALVIWLSTRRFIDPLLRFTSHVQEVTVSQSYHEPLQVATRDEIALAKQREFYENLLQNSAVPCFVIDVNHKVLTWTRACEELSGVPAAEVLGSDRHWQAFYPEKRPCLVDLIIDGDLEQAVDLYESFANSPFIPEGIRAEGWFQAVGGKPRYLFFEAAPIRDSNGALLAAIETLHDLTGLKQIEQALREGEQSSRSLIERSPDSIIVHREGKVVFVNRAAVRLFAASSSQEMVQIQVKNLIPPDCREHFGEQITQKDALEWDIPYIEGKILRFDNTEINVESASIPFIYGGLPAVQTFLRDITDRKEQQMKTWRHANFDSLTGLPNRMMLFDHLRRALEHAKRKQQNVALLFIGLYQFKEVKDSLGHTTGEAVLREVAQRLGSGLRKTETLARMGGEEFAVLLPGVTDSSIVKIVAERMLQRLAEPLQLPGGEARVSGTVGVAFYPEDSMDPATLIMRADMAMRRAKEKGCNTWCFYTPPLHKEKASFHGDRICGLSQEWGHLK